MNGVVCVPRYTLLLFYMWQLQVENKHYPIYNWLNLISSPTAILQQFSPKVGTVIVDRWELVTLNFESFRLFCDTVYYSVNTKVVKK